MVTTERDTAPYAPVANVLMVIRRARERGVPNPLSVPELQRLGIPSGNAARTLAAIRFLGLVDDEGEHSQSLDKLKRAGTSDYPAALAGIVQSAYRAVFQIVNPAVDGEVQIKDAFRGFQPEAQRERMITLFLGLCKEAAIVEGGPPLAQPRARRSQSAKPAVSPERPQPRGLVPPREPEHEGSPGDGDVDYRLLSVLMQRLPRNGKWTSLERDKWLQAVSANLDLLVEVTDEQV